MDASQQSSASAEDGEGDTVGVALTAAFKQLPLVQDRWPGTGIFGFVCRFVGFPPNALVIVLESFIRGTGVDCCAGFLEFSVRTPACQRSQRITGCIQDLRAH